MTPDRLSTPQLYSRAGCRVRSPGRQGPGTANRQCTNSVRCAHVPVPSTIPRDPAAPSTGRLGPGNGQRPPVEDGSPSLPLLSSPTRPPGYRARTAAQTCAPPCAPTPAPPRPPLRAPRRPPLCCLLSSPPTASPIPKPSLALLPLQAGSARAARPQGPASAAGRVRVSATPRRPPCRGFSGAAVPTGVCRVCEWV